MHIVHFFLLVIVENLICLAYLLEPDLCVFSFILRDLIGVMLQSQLSSKEAREKKSKEPCQS